MAWSTRSSSDDHPPTEGRGGDRRRRPGRRQRRHPARVRVRAPQGRGAVEVGTRGDRGHHRLVRCRHPQVRRAVHRRAHRPDAPRPGHRLRQGLLRATRRRRRGWSGHRAAGPAGHLASPPRTDLVIQPVGRVRRSHGRCSNGCPSCAGTASTLGCSSTWSAWSASTRSPRSTSAPGPNGTGARRARPPGVEVLTVAPAAPTFGRPARRARAPAGSAGDALRRAPTLADLVPESESESESPTRPDATTTPRNSCTGAVRREPGKRWAGRLLRGRGLGSGLARRGGRDRLGLAVGPIARWEPLPRSGLELRSGAIHQHTSSRTGHTTCQQHRTSAQMWPTTILSAAAQGHGDPEPKKPLSTSRRRGGQS